MNKREQGKENESLKRSHGRTGELRPTVRETRREAGREGSVLAWERKSGRPGSSGGGKPLVRTPARGAHTATTAAIPSHCPLPQASHTNLN